MPYCPTASHTVVQHALSCKILSILHIAWIHGLQVLLQVLSGTCRSPATYMHTMNMHATLHLSMRQIEYRRRFPGSKLAVLARVPNQ